MALTAGAETRVNSFTTGDQRAQQVTGLADGGWVVTWQSAGQDGDASGVYQQRYGASGAKVGGEIRVNSYTTSSQSDAKVVALDSGGWVVAWNSHGQEIRPSGELASIGVYQQAFGASGAKVGGETQVNVVTPLGQQDPVLAALPGGGWVTVWAAQEDDGSPFGEFRLYQRVYNASGAATSGEIEIGSSIPGQLSAATITLLKAGGWVVTWSTSGTATDVYQQVFSNSGAVVHATARVNTYTALNQTDARITALNSGGWVVTWTSNGQDGNGGGIYQQAYKANGTALGVETRVNSTTAGNQVQSQVVPLKSGGWVVLWQTDSWPTYSLTLQAFDANGNKVGAESQVSPPTNVITQHQVTALSDASWVVVWNGSDGNGNGVLMQLYAANGSKVGGAQIVNDYRTGEQGLDASIGRNHSKVEALPNGGFVVTWISRDQDGGGYGVYQKAFLAGGATVPTITGTSGGDRIDATHAPAGQPKPTDSAEIINALGGKDTVQALGGNDTVDGGTGNDSLDGGAGNDLLKGGDGADTLLGGKGNDVLRGGGGKDVLDGGAGSDTADYSDKSKKVEAKLDGPKVVTVKVDGKAEDSIRNVEKIVGGSGEDKLTGDGKANRLDGGGGKDTLSGGAGNDTLVGGAGKDKLEGGGGKDQFVFSTTPAKANVDTIADFKHGQDKLVLDDAIFAAIGAKLDKAEFYAKAGATSAHDASDRIVYDSKSGKLYYDADGKGGAAAVQIATLTDAPKLDAGDFLIV